MNINDFHSSELHQISRTLFESQEATNKQMLRLLYAHREELSKQIKEFETGLNNQLKEYQEELEEVLYRYQEQRRIFYQEAVSRLMTVHHCSKPEILEKKTSNERVNHG